jgi:hypothetical protein
LDWRKREREKAGAYVERDVGVPSVHRRDGESGVPGHGAVQCAVRQQRAVDVVGGVGRHGADHVRRVDVLEGDREAGLLLEMLLDLVGEPEADVEEHLVAGRVVGVGEVHALGDEVLAGALGHDDDHVAVVAEALLDELEEAAPAVEVEGRLRDEAAVDVAAGERGVHGDEAAVPAHELDDPDAVLGALGLDVRGVDGALRLLHGGVEAEGLVDDGDVVIDGLGHADDGALEAAPLHLLVDGRGALLRAVAADDVHLVDPAVLDAVHDLGRVLAAAGGAQHRAAALVDVVDGARRELHRVARVEALVPALDAVHGGHAVHVVQAADELADDGVEARAQPAAGHDRRRHLVRLEVHALPRAGAPEVRPPRAALVHHDLLRHRVVRVHEVLPARGRIWFIPVPGKEESKTAE